MSETSTPYQLTDIEKKELKKAFDVFDRNGDGTLSVKELAIVMSSLGKKMKTRELKQMIAEVDLNDNGKIDLEEFYVLMGDKYVHPTPSCEIRAAFEIFDKDKNGYITRSELKQAMKQIGEKLTSRELDAMMSKADTDGDNLVNYEEFVAVMHGSL